MNKKDIVKSKKQPILKNKGSHRTLIEQRDEILLNGKKLERGKDYDIDKRGKLTLNKEILKKIENCPNLDLQTFYSQKIIRK